MPRSRCSIFHPLETSIAIHKHGIVEHVLLAKCRIIQGDCRVTLAALAVPIWFAYKLPACGDEDQNVLKVQDALIDHRSTKLKHWNQAYGSA